MLLLMLSLSSCCCSCCHWNAYSLWVFCFVLFVFYTTLGHTVTLADGWKTQAATSKGIKGECQTLVCAETKVCVRMPTPQKRTRVCVSVPVDCGDPVVSGGSLQWNGTQPGDVAILTCNSGHELISAASNLLTCDVTSRWMPPDVACIRVYAFSLSFSPSLSLSFCNRSFSFRRGLESDRRSALLRTGTAKIKSKHSTLRPA